MIRRTFKLVFIIAISIFIPYLIGHFFVARLFGERSNYAWVDWCAGGSLLGLSLIAITAIIAIVSAIIDYIKYGIL